MIQVPSYTARASRTRRSSWCGLVIAMVCAVPAGFYPALNPGLAVGLNAAGATAVAHLAEARHDARSRITVRILSQLHPVVLELSGPRAVRLRARGADLLADDRLVSQPLELPAGAWTARVGGAQPRYYQGAASIRTQGGELQVTFAMELETYVAAVTASESEPGTPLEALKAQAVVARSYALAGAPRHEGADACDLAHCQVLSGRGGRHHLAAARGATSATRGLVLTLPAGAVARAPFHAACGGHTADPVAVFGAPDGTGAAAVPDPGCSSASWTAVLGRRTVEAAVARVMSSSSSLTGGPDGREARELLVRAGTQGGKPPMIEDLSLEMGAGGYVARVIDRRSGRLGSGDALARALDAAAGWGVVRSARFEWRVGRRSVYLAGRGIGHGVGLCQAGAVRQAREGRGYDRILAHYFPGARLKRF